MSIHRDLTAADVMTTEVVCFEETQSVLEVARTLLDREISGAPVVNGEGRMVGVVTEEDLLGVLYEGHRDLAKTKLGSCAVLGSSLVTRRVLAVGPETPAVEIAKHMMIKKVKRLPVIDGARKILGIVSRRDLLRAMVERASG